MTTAPTRTPTTAIEELTAFRGTDLHDLCDAAEAAIEAGGGFGWLHPPARDVMESYWRGVLMISERRLFVGRLDGTIAASAQLVRPPRNNEAQAHSAQLTTSFVAPWARGHGLAKMTTVAVEDAARAAGFRVLNLDVRETMGAAIQLYHSLGYQHFGSHPNYARVDGHYVTGLYFWKDLETPPGGEGP
jgi:ribosomal protein S18 acetylase RimI-like enzyme